MMEEAATHWPWARCGRVAAGSTWQRAAPIVLLVLTALVTARYIGVGGFRFTDAARHAMSGVFVLDFALSGEWSDPQAFAELYYARYPCLGIPNYYPPLFHMVEAVFFGFLGISPVTARLCVLVYHLAAVALLYVIVRGSHGMRVALWCGLFFATSPVVLAYSRQTMLEAPSTAMMLLATWCLTRFERQGSWRWAGAWGLALVACLATKQTTVMILPAHGLYWLARHGLAGRGRAAALAVGVVALLAVGCYATYSYRHAPFVMRALTTSPAGTRLAPEHLLRYPSILPALIGWPAVLAAGLGLARLAARSAERPAAGPWLAWLVAFLLVQVNLTGHHWRYGYLWTPAWAWLAAWGADWLGHSLRWRWCRCCVAAALAGGAVWGAARSQPPMITGYAEAARFVATLPGGDAVLVDAVWDGDFVFSSRQYDPHHRFILRGSKVLYAYASYKNVGFKSFVETPDDLTRLLRRYGVRYVVLENTDGVGTTAGRLLRQMVRGEGFARRAQFRIETQGRLVESPLLEVYEYLEAEALSALEIELEFPGLGRTIHVPLGGKAAWRPRRPWDPGAP